VAIKKKSGPVRAKTAKKKAGGDASGVVEVKDSVKPKAASKPKAKAAPKAPSRRASATADKVAAARSAALQSVVIKALDDMKALEVKVLDVRGLTDVADTMIIASGTCWALWALLWPSVWMPPSA